MTQSGQGHDPQNSAAGPAREGIVLPANGEPWVPDQQAAPPAGQPWGQPWGPDRQAAPAPQSYGEAPAPQSYGEAPAPQQGYEQPQAYGQGRPQEYGQAQQGYAPAQAQHHQAPQAPQPQQPQGGQGFPAPPQGQPPLPPLPPSMPQQAPQQPGAPLPPAGSAAEATALLPHGVQNGHGAPGALPPEGQYGSGQQPQQPYGQPPQQQYGQQPQQQYGQQPQGPTGELVRATPQTGAPLPPAASDAEATALISPFDAPSGGPGAAPLPPEASTRPETPDESTTMLRAIKPNRSGHRGQAQPLPQSQPMPGAPGAGDSEATQLIPPVGAGAPPPPPGAPYGVRPGAPGDRPTPAEFDGLFRDGPGTPGQAGAPDSTAQLPRFEDPGRPPYAQQQGQGQGQQFPPGGYDQKGSYDDDGGGRRRLAPIAIVGIVIVALAGAGLGLGWALSGGGSDDSAKKQGGGADTTKAAKESEQPKPSADPAEAQAKGLDGLLGDSNNSRSSVIGAVNSIKSCSNLGGAAKDLRAAAGQRSDLVKRLQQLPVDKIPNHAQLTATLTKAWQSSAAADNHYAAWAGQVGSKKGCHKGKARLSKQTAQGNAASGQATTAKKQAAQIWNPLAQKYGLTERRPEQL
ncbi:hypothetical protein ACGFWI_37355 [Streptomyces sp. NPDC048434]|uniref:hypothetical protein n=1 Tax=Streptomyces sp. NPDC048434 TaxID=3365549 RepID=UPI0037214DDB